MSMIASGRESVRALAPALDTHAQPTATTTTPIVLPAGLSWPPPRRVWFWAPVVLLGECGLLFALDRLVAAHMGAG